MTTIAYSPLYLGGVRDTGRYDVSGHRIQRHAMFGDKDVYLSYPFGPRQPLQTPLGSTPIFHNGIDWAPVPLGATIPIIFSDTAPNCVIQRIDVDLSQPNGYAVVVRHAYPWWSFYLHLATDPRQRWQVGQPIKAGDLIGPMGTTGLSTGVHLHHAVWEVAAPAVWGLSVPSGFPGFISKPHDPAKFYVDAPSAAPQLTNGWVEVRDLLTLPQFESLVTPAYFDRGTLVGVAKGDLDSRVKIEDDGNGLVRVVEIRQRL